MYDVFDFDTAIRDYSDLAGIVLFEQVFGAVEAVGFFIADKY